jgi:adenosine deaminase
MAVQRALNLDAQQIYELAENSFQASFLSELKKREMLAKLEKFRAKENYLTFLLR